MTVQWNASIAKGKVIYPEIALSPESQEMEDKELTKQNIELKLKRVTIKRPRKEKLQLKAKEKRESENQEIRKKTN